MALHDNPVWILSHIQNSFVVSDDTGNSELVLQNDVRPYVGELAERENAVPYLKQHLQFSGDHFDEVDGEDDVDGLSRSVEIRPGRNPLGYRPRCNTERKLEKMKHDMRSTKAVDIRTVSWRETSSDNHDPDQLFPKKDLSKGNSATVGSLLSQRLDATLDWSENPFADFSRIEASRGASDNVKVRVFVDPVQNIDAQTATTCITGDVPGQSLIRDVIGYICWRYTDEKMQPPLKEDVDKYALFLAESDGSVEWDLRPIDRHEPINKFSVSHYALVPVESMGNDESSSKPSFDVKVTLPDGTYTLLQLPSRELTAKSLIDKVMSRHKVKAKPDGVEFSYFLEAKQSPGVAVDPSSMLSSVDDTDFYIVRENSRRFMGDDEFKKSAQRSSELNAIDATAYQEYRDVWMVTKIRSKFAVVLAISQDKLDIFAHQTPSSRFLTAATILPYGGSISMENIVACDLTEKPEGSDDIQWTFRIVVEHNRSYKKVYFQAAKLVVVEIHAKLGYLLAWHSSKSRSNYIVYKELKGRRRRTNIF